MIEAIVEALFGFLIELFIEIVVELLFEGFLYGLTERLNLNTKEFAAVIEAAGYGIVGLMLGGLSLLVFPNSFIENPQFAIVNLIISPIAAGGMMVAMGAFRVKRGQNPIRFDSFLNGVAFGLGLTVLRFFFA